MSNDVVEIKEESKDKLREFDEQEAYFLLCEIFANAQATKDYAKFQTDLNEWKKRFPVELFSETYKAKIKFMLSKEFLDTVLKNFIAFDELSKKDPSKGLEKLRKTLNRAEKHKDAKQLDKDLDELYKEYPLKYLKEKYPHLVGQLLSKANRTRILEKFDSSLAFKELNTIIEHPQDFETADAFKEALDEWQKLYPTTDFNDKFKPDVEKILTETLLPKNLEELFPVSTELDLSEGEVIPLELKDTVKNLTLVSKDALHEFFKIVDKNKGDINSLFDWTCKYNRYINSFDPTIKTAIVDNLMSKYAYELPPVGTKFQIPKMDADMNDLLSLSDFQNINDTKKQVVLQLLGILSTGKELTKEDNYRLEVIDLNVQKVKKIEKAKIEPKVDLFMEKFPEDKLTPSDPIYLAPILDSEIINETELPSESHIEENNVSEIDEDNLSFKDTIKVDEPLEKVDSTSGNNSASDGGGTSGGTGLSISANEVKEALSDVDIAEEKDEKKADLSQQEPIQNVPHNIYEEPTIQAVILESEPNTLELDEKDIPETTNNGETSSEISPVVESEFQETEEPKSTSTFQSFFKRFLGREKTSDDDRDER